MALSSVTNHTGLCNEGLNQRTKEPKNQTRQVLILLLLLDAHIHRVNGRAKRTG